LLPHQSGKESRSKVNPLRYLQPNIYLLSFTMRFRLIVSTNGEQVSLSSAKSPWQLTSLIVQIILAYTLGWLCANTLAYRGLRGASTIFAHDDWLLQGDSFVVNAVILGCTLLAQGFRFCLWVVRAQTHLALGKTFYLLALLFVIGMCFLWFVSPNLEYSLWVGNPFQFSSLWIVLSAILFIGLGDLRKTRESYKNLPRLD
jgi:hypothetical protein